MWAREREEWKKRNDFLNFKIAINWVGNDSTNYVNADGIAVLFGTRESQICIKLLKLLCCLWMDSKTFNSDTHNCSDTQQIFMFVRYIEVLLRESEYVSVCALFILYLSIALSYFAFLTLNNFYCCGFVHCTLFETLVWFWRLSPFPTWWSKPIRRTLSTSLL